MADSLDWTQTLRREPSQSPTALPRGDDRYQTVGLLGQGGMGRVVEAVDKQFHRVVAVKELRGDRVDAEATERFELEALITGNLEHPGIPAVYERGLRPGGLPFYVMRRVKGRNLGELLTETKTLEERLALLPAVLQAALAVGFAHGQTVVHRDLKPANIVVGPHGEVVVIDWGLAKVRGVALFPSGEHQAVAAAESRPGHVQGTPAYMAPEQAHGHHHEVDERTDVFALGAILYHLLTGRAPYDGQSAAEVIAHACACKPVPVEKLAKSAPEQLRAICHKAMSADPAERYPNAAALAEALRSFATRALSDTSERRASLFANIVGLGTMVMLLMTYLVVSRYWPPYSEYGPPAFLIVGISLAGLVTSLVEERTHGRYQLGPIALVLAGATLLATLAASGGQLGMRLRDFWAVEGTPQAVHLASRAVGAMISVLGIGTFQTAIQLVVYGVIRRRLLLGSRT